MPSTPGTSNFPTSLDDVISLGEVKNNASSTITDALTTTTLNIPVADASEFPASGFATLVDDLDAPTAIEIVIYTSKSGSNLVVPSTSERGALGSTAQNWSNGAFIEQRPVSGYHEGLRGGLIATQTKLGYGSDTAAANEVLRGTGSGTSDWGAITNAYVSASAAIALSKLATVTASRALVSDASGFVSASSVTATELGYLSGVTSAIQTQINGLSSVYQPLDADLTTIAGLADPNADRVLFWDDSAGAYAYLTVGSGLSITDTTLTASGGGDALTSNPLSQFASTTSAQLAGVISDETGSGALVFANTPTLVTPVLGVATATSINKVALTAPATSATLTIADGKTLTANASLTLTGTDSTTITFQGTDTYVGRTTTDTLTNKTLTTPTIASFTNATHDHSNAAGGGTLNASAIAAGTLTLARGGTGASLADPDADRVLFWDDSAGAVTWLTIGTNLSISDTTLNASAGAGGYATIAEDGSDLTQRTKVNFIGSGLTAADNAGASRTDVTIHAQLSSLADLATNGGIYRTASNTITARTLTGTSNRIVITDGDGVSGAPTFDIGTDVVTLTGSQTLTNKVLTAPDINGGTADSLTSLSVRSTGAAFDLTIASSEVLTAGKTLSFVLGDTDRTLTIGASASVSGTNTGDQTSVSGNAGTATALQTARTINGTSFDGTANITVTAAAGTLTGTTLNSSVVTSSLTTVGALASGSLTTGFVVGGVTMTLGSDADGDIYYRSSNVLTRLAKGTALHVLRMNAGATAPEWAAASGGSPAGSDGDYQINLSSAFAAGVLNQSTTGRLTITPSTVSSGVDKYFRIITPADSGLTADTEAIGMQFGGNTSAATVTRTLADGTTIATQRESVFVRPTYAAAGATTLTKAATLAITDGPAQGSNVTITNPYALWVQAGRAQFDGSISSPGSGSTTEKFGSTASTGTATTSIVLGNNILQAGTGNVVIGMEGTTHASTVNNAVMIKGISAANVGQVVCIGGTATADFGVVIGYAAAQNFAASASMVQIGRNTSSGASSGCSGGVLIGHGGAMTGAPSIGLGLDVSVTAAALFVAGSSTGPMTNVHFGKGVTNSSATAYTINGTGGSGSNNAGAGVNIAGGKGTGTAAGGSVALQTSIIGSSGSSLNTLVDRVIVNGARKTLTDAATDLFEIALPTLKGYMLAVTYEIFATDATDVQVRRGVVHFSGVNKGGSYTLETPAIISEGVSASSGTLTATFAQTSGTNKVTISVTPSGSLTETTYYMIYTIENNSEQAITIL